ncbi:MAG TPA: plastocyanin/azurin family copper-binding protein [Thermoleophilaceae bacterium]|jgi:plastocyanin|nr:plastocyanin/azurin family copper-binding protein [Thermoleophilaceae bacterium]
MRKPLVLGLLASMLTLLLVAGPAVSKRRSLAVSDNYFVKAGSPRKVTVERNDTVVWSWRGSNPHNVTVTRGPLKFASRTKTSGVYRKKLRRRGTYRILCTVHAPTMRMTLEVE